NEHLRVLVQKGEYWYLPSDRGITGSAFTTGRTIIEVPQNVTHYREAGTAESVKSEIAVPIFMGSEPIGAFLFDLTRDGKEFNRDHQRILEAQAEIIKNVLSDKDPWSFRSWYADERKRKTRNLLHLVKKQFKGSIRDKFARDPDVEIRIAEIDEHGAPGTFEALLETPSTLANWSRDDEDDPIKQAVFSGIPQTTGERVPRYRCYVPYPIIGPTAGLVKLESSKESFHTEQTVELILEELQKLNMDNLSVSESGQVDGNYYLNFVHSTLTAHLSSTDLPETLKRIIDQTTRLCGEEVKLFCVSESLDSLLGPGKKDPINVLSSEKLLSTQLGIHNFKVRPQKVNVLESRIICPAWDMDDVLIGALSVPLSKKLLEDNFNTQVIGLAAILLRQVVENFRMRKKCDESDAGTALKYKKVIVSNVVQALRSTDESKDVYKWLQSINRIDLDEYRVIGNFVTGDPKERSRLSLAVDGIAKRFNQAGNKPYPVLICAPPGSGKTYIAQEIALSLVGEGRSAVDSNLIKVDLAATQDIASTLRALFKKILVADKPRIALLDEVDTKVGDENAYRFLLSAVEGKKVDLGDGAEGKLGSVLWFFTASSAEDKDAFLKEIEKRVKGADFFRRFDQAGAFLQLPKSMSPMDSICQVLSNARNFRPKLDQIQASVLYYFAVSKWSDAGALLAAVRTATQDAGSSDILKLDTIASRDDYLLFMKTHRDAIEDLNEKLIRW
ncbi:MAG: GAF domain-containing protein, partial [Calditrichaeota bacterium]|nr:GAF domain-containing protein [Calditrichota bacterium]